MADQGTGKTLRGPRTAVLVVADGGDDAAGQAGDRVVKGLATLT